jgi:hypothetical protein
MTNHRFQYRDARDNHELRLHFLEWSSADTPAGRELKDSLNVYKFTKSFEIDCLRAKYLRPTHPSKPRPQKQARPRPTEGSVASRPARETLFQVNKR